MPGRQVPGRRSVARRPYTAPQPALPEGRARVWRFRPAEKAQGLPTARHLHHVHQISNKEPPMAYAVQHPHRGQVATASGLDVLAGIWLLISPFVLHFGVRAAMTNNIILGIVIGVLALIRFFDTEQLAVLSWLNALLGLWVLISPWVLGFAGVRVPMTNNVVMGIIVIILAGWSALATGGGDEMNRPAM